jgi:hypothetical protein
MNGNNKDDMGVEPIKFFGLIIPKIPFLMFRFTGIFLRFKSDANKAGKIFHKELIKNGINEETASDLTDIYMESSHIRSFIQNFN